MHAAPEFLEFVEAGKGLGVESEARGLRIAVSGALRSPRAVGPSADYLVTPRFPLNGMLTIVKVADRPIDSAG